MPSDDSPTLRELARRSMDSKNRQERKGARRMMRLADVMDNEREIREYARDPGTFRGNLEKEASNFPEEYGSDYKSAAQKAIDRALEQRAKRIQDQKIQEYIKEWNEKVKR